MSEQYLLAEADWTDRFMNKLLRSALIAICFLTFSTKAAEWRIAAIDHKTSTGFPWDLLEPKSSNATRVVLTHETPTGKWARDSILPVAVIFWDKRAIHYGLSSGMSGELDADACLFSMTHLESMKQLLAIYAGLPPNSATNLNYRWNVSAFSDVAIPMTCNMDRAKREISMNGVYDSQAIKFDIHQPKALLFLIDSLSEVIQRRDSIVASGEEQVATAKARSEEQSRQLRSFVKSERWKVFRTEVAEMEDKIGRKEAAEKAYLQKLLEVQIVEGNRFGNERNYRKAQNAYANAVIAHQDSKEITTLKNVLKSKLNEFKSRFGVAFDQAETQIALTSED